MIEYPKRTNCYHYDEEHDMGATVHCCKMHKGFGNCPCTPNCQDYISAEDAHNLIVYIQQVRRNNADQIS